MVKESHTRAIGEEVAFTCPHPHCKTYAKQFGYVIDNPKSLGLQYITYSNKNIVVYICEHCKNSSFWIEKNIIFPDVNNSPPPNDDMPHNVKEIYNEAGSIVNKSPRAAAALMRLALEELCKELQCEGKTLQNNIDFLVNKKDLPRSIEKAMDAVRIIGNEAVHPGTIDLQDNIDTVTAMFKLMNMIVQQTISKPKEIDSIYATLPDNKKRKGTQQ